MFQVTQIHAGGFDDNFSYVIHDPASLETAIVDPCGDVSKIRCVLETLSGCVPKYILITHGHQDHTSGLSEVRRFFQAPTVAHPVCRVYSDIALSDGMQLPFGDSFIQCIFTPGHSVSSVCYLTGDHSALFTGDTLFVGCCGYCDPEEMFRTMREVLLPLPDEAIVYSGHDYGEVPFDTLGSQKKVNPYLMIEDLAEFKEAIKDL